MCKMAIQNRVEESNGQTGSWKFWFESEIKTKKKEIKQKKPQNPRVFPKGGFLVRRGPWILLMQHSKSADFQWLHKNSFQAQCEVKYLVEKKLNVEGTL